MTVKLFDTHSHYNLKPLLSSWEKLMLAAKKVGLIKSVVVGTDMSSNLAALNLQQQVPTFFLAAAGIHPELAISDEQIAQELSFLRSIDPKSIVAYGELGLDFYHFNRQDSLFLQQVKFQLTLLQVQLELAAENKKPLILHVRDDFCAVNQLDNAYGLLINTLLQSSAKNLPLIFHCFSGNQEYLEKIIAEFPQAYISFAGNLTFKSAGILRQLSLQVPPDRLLLETDSPFLSPEPQRGRPCLPEFFAHTATFVQNQLHFDLEQIYLNSCQVFNLKP